MIVMRYSRFCVYFISLLKNFHRFCCLLDMTDFFTFFIFFTLFSRF